MSGGGGGWRRREVGDGMIRGAGGGRAADKTVDDTVIL